MDDESSWKGWQVGRKQNTKGPFGPLCGSCGVDRLLPETAYSVTPTVTGIYDVFFPDVKMVTYFASAKSFTPPTANSEPMPTFRLKLVSVPLPVAVRMVCPLDFSVMSLTEVKCAPMPARPYGRHDDPVVIFPTAFAATEKNDALNPSAVRFPSSGMVTKRFTSLSLSAAKRM